MSFTIYRPIKTTYIGGGGSTIINQTVDISGVNIDISANINVDISNVSLDVSGTFTTDICQYSSLYWQNVNKTIGKVSLADSANIDAFGRLRVSNPETLFDGKMIDSSQNIIFDISCNNGGRLVYLQNESANYIPVISIRLRPGFSKGELKPLFYNLVGGGGTTLYYRVLRNATLTTPSWTNVNDYSQVDITSTSVTGGQIMDTGFVINSQRLAFADVPDNLLVFQQDMNGTPDTLTIAMKAETGGAGKKVRSSITWQEIV